MVLPWTDLFRPGEVAVFRVKDGILSLGGKKGKKGIGVGMTRSWTRVVFFSLLGAQGVVVPFVHATVLNGLGYTSRVFGYAAWVTAPICLGSFVYATRIPERWWPGRFDFVGNSHNIWHVATAVSAVVGCEVMGRMFEVARGG